MKLYWWIAGSCHMRVTVYYFDVSVILSILVVGLPQLLVSQTS